MTDTADVQLAVGDPAPNPSHEGEGDAFFPDRLRSFQGYALWGIDCGYPNPAPSSSSGSAWRSAR